MPRLVAWCLLLLATTVASEENTDGLREELVQTVSRIEDLSDDLKCGDKDECAWLPISRSPGPCRGPGDFRMYSTAVGHEAIIELLTLAERSRRLAHQIGLTEPVLWACGIWSPPPLICYESSCVALDPAFDPENIRDARVTLEMIVFATRLEGLSSDLADRDVDAGLIRKVLIRSAYRITACLLEEASNDPESTLAPLVNAAAAIRYANEDLYTELVAQYGEQTASGQMRIAESILKRCVESDRMHVLSVYPRLP